MSQPDDIVTRAKKLRQQGLTYAEIGHELDISQPKIWIILNRDRHNANTRDSKARYRARNFTALCDMPPESSEGGLPKGA